MSEDPKARARRLKWIAANPEKHKRSQSEWVDRNRDERNRRIRDRRKDDDAYEKNKEYRLRTQYGISYARYCEMLADQGGVCAICRRPESRRSKRKVGVEISPLVVDHNHQTGAVRALLCHRCNAAVGFLEECPDRMRAMAAYVEAHKRDEDGGA